ncbi:hypothetical protein ERO13_D08G218066v2 [Gossypium hirsutum]|nr:hypothetical protein ERO13_D08G218066v2 [Gossypium hirsutum]TYG58793.1 hypothetical protein ES288_D08G250900v1 [Gossypium darwinii]
MYVPLLSTMIGKSTVPLQIWEVKGACLTISPKYHAAIGVVDPDKIAGMHNDQNTMKLPRKMIVRTIQEFDYISDCFSRVKGTYNLLSIFLKLKAVKYFIALDFNLYEYVLASLINSSL